MSGSQQDDLERDEATAEEAVDAAPTERPLGVYYLEPAWMEFTQTPGGVLRLTLPDHSYRRVTILRTQPLTDPARYLSVRDDDDEIGMLRSLDGFSPEQRALLEAELERRYFRPVIRRVHSISDSHGSFLWEVETDRGAVNFATQHPRYSALPLDDGRWMLTDVDNNRFEIRDISGMDSHSRRLLNELLG